MKDFFTSGLFIDAVKVAICATIGTAIPICVNKIRKKDCSPYSSIAGMMIGMFIGLVIVFW